MVKAVKAVIVFGTQAELTKIAAFVKGGISELEVLPLWTQQHVDLVPMAAIDLELEEILSFTSDSVDWQSIALRLREESPDLVVVQGDTRSALNGAFAASKLKIPVMHLEAGLRLSTELEPEERARRRITRLSAYHVVTSRKSKDNLIEEGVSQDNIIQIPHLAELYLSYLYSLDKGSLEEGMFDEPYIVVTMHRTTNLDLVIECADSLSRLGSILDGIQMVFVKRPDPRWNDLYNSLKKTENVLLSQTLIPSSFNRLIRGSIGVLTDSAGVQQECAILGIPHVVLRAESEYVDCAPHVECRDSQRLIKELNKMLTIESHSFKGVASIDWASTVGAVWQRVVKWLN